ncbi:flavin reductase family protein [uncultured Methanobrevibacter sp.]|uniref:flavin reductase family protein n=1 Tax=uncultured Methanobrevibacter sp. TaxID=253161 RepID=UPI00262D4196|nr:flavin reductase family protein [uncultured Methanobrevibacter sp.]
MKINQKPRAMMFPAPAVVASAYDEDGKADCCTLAFATMCSHHPPAVMIAINTTLKRKTLKSILHTGEFCIGFPSVEHVAETDYMGIASGYDTDKIRDVGFTFSDGKVVNAPIINEFAASLECRLIHTADVGSHTQLTGEIVNVRAEEDILDEKGKISYQKLDPICYDDVSHTYFSIGSHVGDGFKIGLKFRK